MSTQQQTQQQIPEVFLKWEKNGMMDKIRKEIDKKDTKIIRIVNLYPGASWRRKYLTSLIIKDSKVTLRYEAAVSNILLEKYGRYGLK